MYTTGLLYDDCDKWDDKKHDKKTWANFQAHFQEAQRKFKRKQKSLTRAGGYHGVNNKKYMNGTHDALINLATLAA